MAILSANKSIIVRPKIAVDIVGALGTPVQDTVPLIGAPPLAACPTIWTSRVHPGSNAGRQRAAFNGIQSAPQFLALGGVRGGAIARSTDGITWVLSTTAMTDEVTGAAWSPDHNIWVAGGWNTGPLARVETSPDGIAWTNRTIPARTQIYKVVYGNGRFIIACIVARKLIYSDDGGVTWAETGFLNPTVDGNYNGLATDGAGTWLCIRDTGVVYKSTDNGSTWALTGGNTPSVTWDVVWSPELALWVAVTATATVQTSPDGVTWTQRFIDGTKNLYRIAYSNGGCFIATGGAGYAIQSTDAVTWAPITIGISGNILGIVPGYDNWVATSDTEIYTGAP